jgi:hypothetical protein
MFSFGLFSTHIPYIVIAAIYLLYCGSSILNRLETQEDEQQTHVGETRITDLATNVDLKTVRYQDVQDRDFHTEAIGAKWDFAPSRFLPELLYIPDIKYIGQYTCPFLFSRPPPHFC